MIHHRKHRRHNSSRTNQPDCRHRHRLPRRLLHLTSWCGATRCLLRALLLPSLLGLLYLTTTTALTQSTCTDNITAISFSMINSGTLLGACVVRLPSSKGEGGHPTNVVSRGCTLSIQFMLTAVRTLSLYCVWMAPYIMPICAHTIIGTGLGRMAAGCSRAIAEAVGASDSSMTHHLVFWLARGHWWGAPPPFRGARRTPSSKGVGAPQSVSSWDW